MIFSYSDTVCLWPPKMRMGPCSKFPNFGAGPAYVLGTCRTKTCTWKQGRIHDCSCRGRWAGAIMIWTGAVMIWAGTCSNINFPTLKMPKNAKKHSVADRPTDTVTYRSRARDKKKKKRKR